MTGFEHGTAGQPGSTGEDAPPDLDRIASILGQRSPVITDLPGRTRAAVAMILRETGSGLKVLLIERALHDGDPWSGDLGFPGGKLEDQDAGLRAAAERETWEELGVDLKKARLLGRLDDIPGAHLPVVVAAFAYGLPESPEFSPSPEIKGVFWVALRELFDPRRRLDAKVHFRGQDLIRPALVLPLPGRTILWGITYRIVTGLRERLGVA